MDIKLKVGVVVFDSQGRVLLIKERSANSVARWNIIKGTFEGHETIFDTAVRECREEAGISIELTGVLGTYISETDFKIRVQCNLTATSNDLGEVPGQESQHALDETIEEVRWFTQGEIKEIKSEEFISKRTEILLQDITVTPVYPLDVLKHIEM